MRDKSELFASAQENGDPATGYVFGKKQEGYVYLGRFWFVLNDEPVQWPQDDARPLTIKSL